MNTSFWTCGIPASWLLSIFEFAINFHASYRISCIYLEFCPPFYAFRDPKVLPNFLSTKNATIVHWVL